jgi:hypothetical protein
MCFLHCKTGLNKPRKQDRNDSGSMTLEIELIKGNRTAGTGGLWVAGHPGSVDRSGVLDVVVRLQESVFGALSTQRQPRVRVRAASDSRALFIAAGARNWRCGILEQHRYRQRCR